MIKTTNNTNNNNNILTYTDKCSSNNIIMETKEVSKNALNSLSPTHSIKTERRLSSTSESSVEPMDLGRTPTPPPVTQVKKLFKSKSQNDEVEPEKLKDKNSDNSNDLHQTTPKRIYRSYSYQDIQQHESNEIQQTNDCNEIEPKTIDTKKLCNTDNNNRHNSHFYRNNTVVEIESNNNPNSLRKKFRISTTTNTANNKYCTNRDVKTDSNNELKPNNNENNEKSNNRSNNTEENQTKCDENINEKTTNAITSNSLTSSVSSSQSSSRRGSEENFDNNSNGSHGDGIHGGIDTNSDDDISNRTNQNESGFVDGSSNNLINSINSISSPECGGNGNVNTGGNNGINFDVNNKRNGNSIINKNNIGANGNEEIKYVCPICEVVSATPHEFTNHIRSHNYSSGDTENFTCRICSKVLSSASSLDRHVLVHTGERPFNCKYCHLTFTTNGNMHRHMRTHKQHPHQKRRSSNNNNNNNTMKNSNSKDSSNGSLQKINNCNTNTMNTTNSLNNLLINNNSTNEDSITANNNNGNNTNISTNVNMLKSINTVMNQKLNNFGGGDGINAIIGNNGNGGGGGGESCESEDGGCSTDSSASNNSSNYKLDNIRNNSGNKNYDNVNTDLHNGTINNKRKYSTEDEVYSLVKRRMKTINNNTIVTENNIIGNQIIIDNSNNNQEMIENIHHKFSCPVCSHKDFNDMLSLSTHMDLEHSDIPAKCRQCDVVFKTHKQLTGHRCSLIGRPQSQQQPTTQIDSQIPLLFPAVNLMQSNKEFIGSMNAINEKFPIFTKSAMFECKKCSLAFPSSNSFEIHMQQCSSTPIEMEKQNTKPIPQLIDPQAFMLSNILMQHPANGLDFSKKIYGMPKQFNIQQLMQQQHQQLQQQQKNEKENSTPNDNKITETLAVNQIKRSLSDESLNSSKDLLINDAKDNTKNTNSDTNRNRDEFFAHLDLKNKFSPINLNNSVSSKTSTNDSNINECSEKILDFKMTNLHDKISSPSPRLDQSFSSNNSKQSSIDLQKEKRDQKLQQQLQQNDSRDLADIQSILNVTSSSNNFLRNFEANVNTPIGSEYGFGKDEEEAQDSFTAEFRRMKLRGEFPCKLCTSVFPNLRALKGHNRIHITAAGNAGPFRCNMCLYSIHDKAALIRHMRTHNGDRPYECAECNYAFTTKANCERHLRNRHAKTTREEVKRAIIYHPSEDSSCDDPTKKMHLFSSPDFDNDDELTINPKDRSTPVSHLKEILQSENPPKPPSQVKIQVKSLEKLIDKPNTAADTDGSKTLNNFHPTLPQSFEIDHRNAKSEIDDKSQNLINSNIPKIPDSTGAIDLSMDVLDLSKKTKPVAAKEDNPTIPTDKLETIPDAMKLDFSQQLFLAQQLLLAGALPKLDPSNYFEFCRNLTMNPFLATFNPLLAGGLPDFTKISPFMNSAALFGNSTNNLSNMTFPNSAPQANTNNNHIQLNTGDVPQKDVKPVEVAIKNIDSLPARESPVLVNNLQNTSANSFGNQINLSGNQNVPQTQRLPTPQQLQSNSLNQSANNNGPVKMVIKNGVLMPKQKQRRYRTERPFACEHCSARFTLRSNMERHIKQQHPQYWAQRQRSGQHVMRGRGSSSNVISQIQSSHMRPQMPNSMSSNHYGQTISDQVKYALLAQQLKSRKDSDILQQALTHGSSSDIYNDSGTSNTNNNNNNGNVEDDDNESKLIIDEDDEMEEVDEQDDQEDDYDENNDYNSIEQSEQNDEDYSKEEQVDKKLPENIVGAKKVAETILEQAIKAGSSAVNKQMVANIKPRSENKIINKSIQQNDFGTKNAKSFGNFANKNDECTDLVSVSKLVDNATNNSLTFNNYFKPNDINETTNNVNHMEQSDEEGLVASGSASDNNSGAEESAATANAGQQKKKSAYSLAPNRVPCPYCDRIFPWSSSLRRHILTHTGQKPFKCSQCPLLFTTKSNCDRHLLRKHGNVESAVSLYVPIDDMPDPVPMPKAVAEALQAAKAAKAAAASNTTISNLNSLQPLQQPLTKQMVAENQETIKNLMQNAVQTGLPKTEPQAILQISSTDLPFKCHLCDNSFGERLQCLDHIRFNHQQEFELLLAKGAIDNDAEHNNSQQIYQNSANEDDDKRDDGRGKYPDYANRKVICAFCIRRFWSTEDLRRHMRTHSGERPFQCEVCLRKFTLKHSMLRHMKKHNGANHNNQTIAQNSGSDLSDDDQPSVSMILANSLRNHKINELLNKVSNNGSNDWQQTNRISLNDSNNDNNFTKSENIPHDLTKSTVSNNIPQNSDLIGNLLGISDQTLLNKFLTNPSEAAKFFGVGK